MEYENLEIKLLANTNVFKTTWCILKDVRKKLKKRHFHMRVAEFLKTAEALVLV